MTTNIKALQTEMVLPTMDEMDKFSARKSFDDAEDQEDEDDKKNGTDFACIVLHCWLNVHCVGHRPMAVYTQSPHL